MSAPGLTARVFTEIPIEESPRPVHVDRGDVLRDLHNQCRPHARALDGDAQLRHLAGAQQQNAVRHALERDRQQSRVRGNPVARIGNGHVQNDVPQARFGPDPGQQPVDEGAHGHLLPRGRRVAVENSRRPRERLCALQLHAHQVGKHREPQPVVDSCRDHRRRQGAALSDADCTAHVDRNDFQRNGLFRSDLRDARRDGTASGRLPETLEPIPWHVVHEAWHGLQADRHRRPKPVAPGDHAVAPGVERDEERLQHADRSDRLLQRGEVRFAVRHSVKVRNGDLANGSQGRVPHQLLDVVPAMPHPEGLRKAFSNGRQGRSFRRHRIELHAAHSWNGWLPYSTINSWTPSVSTSGWMSRACSERAPKRRRRARAEGSTSTISLRSRIARSILATHSPSSDPWAGASASSSRRWSIDTSRRRRRARCTRM